MNKKQIERMNQINELIEFISTLDRKFFRYKDRVGHFVAGKTVLYFVDECSQKKVHLNDKTKDFNFQGGGTLWGLVHDFKEWIITENYTNSNNGYGGLYCNNWGYSEKSMELIRNKAKEIGFLIDDSKIDKIENDREIIEEYIKRYTFNIDFLLQDYMRYLRGYYVCQSIEDCINKLEKEIRSALFK